MDVKELVADAKDAMSVKGVYGDIYEKNGLSILPAAKVTGGGGGGEGEDENHREGKGGGFGIRSKPTGVFVIRNDSVAWKPALDVNRMILGGQIVAIVAFFMLRSIVKTWSKVKAAERKCDET